MNTSIDDVRAGPARGWATNPQSSVESLQLRDGMALMLSRFAAGERREFHHVESEDVLGIGFHLHGGTCFDMEGERFSTKPLDVWAGTGPRGAASRFTLPVNGFRTVSLRFSPDAASGFLQSHASSRSVLTDFTETAGEQVRTARLTPLAPAAAAMVEAMFSTPYVGGVRKLFLESCVLGLMAMQFEAMDCQERDANAARKSADLRCIQSAREILDHRLLDPPSIVSLARLAGLNEFKLKRLFKEVFGTTVFGYVRRRRMERAAADLHAGLPVSQAAAAVGYECPRCFADAFRRHYGILPSEMTRGALSKLPLTTY